jgi:hypothetical protein
MPQPLDTLDGKEKNRKIQRHCIVAVEQNRHPMKTFPEKQKKKKKPEHFYNKHLAEGGQKEKQQVKNTRRAGKAPNRKSKCVAYPTQIIRAHLKDANQTHIPANPFMRTIRSPFIMVNGRSCELPGHVSESLRFLGADGNRSVFRNHVVNGS